MTSTNDLYQMAVTNAAHYFTARHTLPNGDVLICSVKKVAGRSVIAKHYRTTWHRVAAGEQYSKTISRAKAVELLEGRK